MLNKYTMFALLAGALLCCSMALASPSTLNPVYEGAGSAGGDVFLAWSSGSAAAWSALPMSSVTAPGLVELESGSSDSSAAHAVTANDSRLVNVASLNSLTGAVTLAAGANITLSPSGNTVTIAASGGGSSYTGAAPITVTGTSIGVSAATTGSLGVVQPDGSTINIASGIISAASGIGGLQPWASSLAYATHDIVIGSDGNFYIAQGATTNNNPVGDVGTHWKLWYLNSTVTLTTGNGGAFSGTSADPAGLQQAFGYLSNFAGGVQGQQVIVQVQDCPVITASAAGSTTTILTTTSTLAVGDVLVGMTGTSGNIHEQRTISAVTGPVSGVYTLTVSSAFTSATASSDTFLAAYSYMSNSITLNNPTLGPFLVVEGDTMHNLSAPDFFPSVSVTTGSLGSVFGYFRVSYTISGSVGETLAGPETEEATGTTGKSFLVAAISGLPSTVTSVNYYAGGAPASLYLFGTQTPSAGTVAAENVTSLPTSGNALPALNPTFPVIVAFGTSSLASGFNSWPSGFIVTHTPGVTFQNLSMVGNKTATVSGLTLASCTASLGYGLVLSDFGSSTGAGLLSTTGSTVTLDGCQIDSDAFGFLNENSMAVSISPVISLFIADGQGSNTQDESMFTNWNPCYIGCTIGLEAQYTGTVRYGTSAPGFPASGTEQAFPGTVTGATTANNGYVST